MYMRSRHHNLTYTLLFAALLMLAWGCRETPALPSDGPNSDSTLTPGSCVDVHFSDSTKCATDNRVTVDAKCAMGWIEAWKSMLQAYGVDTVSKHDMEIDRTYLQELQSSCDDCNSFRCYYGIHQHQDDVALLAVFFVNIHSNSCVDNIDTEGAKILRVMAIQPDSTQLDWVTSEVAEDEVVRWQNGQPGGSPDNELIFPDTTILPVYSRTHPWGIVDSLLRDSSENKLKIQLAMYPVKPQGKYGENYCWPKEFHGDSAFVPALLFTDVIDNVRFSYDIAMPCPVICPGAKLGKTGCK